jgi:hypothetical protein
MIYFPETIDTISTVLPIYLHNTFFLILSRLSSSLVWAQLTLFVPAWGTRSLPFQNGAPIHRVRAHSLTEIRNTHAPVQSRCSWPSPLLLPSSASHGQAPCLWPSPPDCGPVLRLPLAQSLLPISQLLLPWPNLFAPPVPVCLLLPGSVCLLPLANPSERAGELNQESRKTGPGEQGPGQGEQEDGARGAGGLGQGEHAGTGPWEAGGLK